MEGLGRLFKLGQEFSDGLMFDTWGAASVASTHTTLLAVNRAKEAHLSHGGRFCLSLPSKAGLPP